jgi:hypothetical protein
MIEVGWEVDSNRRKLDGGINDIVITANGGAYATLSGPFVNPPGVVVGKIFNLARQSEMVRGGGRSQLRQWYRSQLQRSAIE